MEKTEILSAIEHRAYNDVTREIAREGVTLTWDEIREVGDQPAIDWMRRRLGLSIETSDDEGIRFAPAADCGDAE